MYVCNSICLGIMLSVRNAKINYDLALKYLLVQKVGEMLIDILKNAVG